ncbi:hypothetical protein KY347_02840 [Candidatus Woesearchaeota archaeon]|nr:hypothetical protein [Candidatus Woesearchaeota archaeon]
MSKETIKKFLKAGKWEATIFAVFLLLNVGLIYLHYPITFLGSAGTEIGVLIREYGIPFAFFTEKCPLLPPEEMQRVVCPTEIDFNAYMLVLDIVLWYLFSCLIIFAYNKFKSGK